MKREQFRLRKVTLNDENATVEYSVTEQLTDFVGKRKITENPPGLYHPDLSAAVASFKPALLKVLGFKDLEIAITQGSLKAGEMQAAKELDAVFKMVNTNTEDRVKVKQVSITGEADAPGVVITGVMRVSTGNKVALNTHKISLTTDSWGFEQQLQGFVQHVEDEAFEYVVNNKRAQVEIPFTEGEQEEQEPK